MSGPGRFGSWVGSALAWLIRFASRVRPQNQTRRALARPGRFGSRVELALAWPVPFALRVEPALGSVVSGHA